MSAHPARDTYFVVRHDINHGGFPPFSGEQMSRLRDAADNALAEMELEVQRAKFQSYNELRQRAEQAEAALAERERMLRLALSDINEIGMLDALSELPLLDPADATIESVYADLRTRAEEGSE